MHIPWFTLPPIDLSFIGLGQVYWFSILVIVGIVLGVILYDRVAVKGGDIDLGVARLVPEAGVAGGFVGAHLVHVLLYHPELMDEDPWILLKFWAGISSMGGFFGGAIAVVALLKWYRQPLLPYGDRALLALSLGWAFGRLGCATSHDHPGIRTDFFLGVAFPDGVRHDLGLYEFLFTVLVLLPLLAAITRRPWRTGSLLAAVCLSYAPVRFGLDFLRATDTKLVDSRYLGLTPAQYGAVGMLIAGAAVLIYARRRGLALQPALWGEPRAPAAVVPAGSGERGAG